MVDHIRYDLLTQQALRAVVRNVLADTAKKGLPGEHHFYITFDTRAEGVKLSPRLREQFPKDMTIILQHQFWDLVVTDEGFEVGLSFGGVPERVGVPFDAINAFFDPSVQFGLQFEQIAEQQENCSPAANGHSNGTQQPSPTPEKVSASAPPADSTPPSPDEPPRESEPGGAEVVRLDRFRKK